MSGPGRPSGRTQRAVWVRVWRSRSLAPPARPPAPGGEGTGQPEPERGCARQATRLIGGGSPAVTSRGGPRQAKRLRGVETMRGRRGMPGGPQATGAGEARQGGGLLEPARSYWPIGPRGEGDAASAGCRVAAEGDADGGNGDADSGEWVTQTAARWCWRPRRGRSAVTVGVGLSERRQRAPKRGLQRRGGGTGPQRPEEAVVGGEGRIEARARDGPMWRVSPAGGKQSRRDQPWRRRRRCSATCWSRS